MSAHCVPSINDLPGEVLGYIPSAPESSIHLIPVKSSRISAIAYDEDQMLFFAQFPNGGVYVYEGVEPDVFEALRESDSIGVYFNTYIKGPKGAPIYPYREVPRQGEVVEATSSPARTIEGVIVPRQTTDTISELPERDEELVSRALAVQEEARLLVIGSGEVYAMASNRLVALKAECALVKARLDRVYEPAFAAYKAARDLRDEAIKPYAEAERILKASMLAFHQIEERQRREAETAERRRLEAAARAEAEQRSTDDAEREARYAEAQGEIKLAHSIRSNPIPVAPAAVAPVVLPSSIPDAPGLASRRENWQYRIVDASRIPLTHEYYSLDERKICTKAKLLKSHANIPGVDVYDAGTISARKKA